MGKKLPLLTCAIMMKDEEPRILRTMSTVVKHVDSFVILDTGSSDRSMDVAAQYCKEHNKPLFLYESPFVDFATTRNVLLKHCEGKSEFILLMDANDEVRNPKILIEFLQGKVQNKKEIVFTTRFELANDMRPGARSIYSRICVIRNNTGKLYYEMPVHEKITCKDISKFINNATLTKTDFHMFQDRAKDKPSTERYKKDLEILKKYAAEHGETARILHYLCQTSINMSNYPELRTHAEKLVKYDDGEKYIEFIFFAHLHMGTTSFQLEREKREWLPWLLKAYKYSKRKYERCEPLYMLALYYLLLEEYDEALVYIKKACEIPMPGGNAHLETQIDPAIYEVNRHKLKEHIQGKINERDLGEAFEAKVTIVE